MHDIFALGVVLLEIGPWRTAASIYGNICAKSAEEEGREGSLSDPRICREAFIDLAKRKLPHSMGPAYSEPVATCLLGDFESTPGRNVDMKVMFHERVIQNLDIKKPSS